LKLLLVVFIVLAAWVLLGSSFGLDLSPEKLLEFLACAVGAIISFFAKFLEGLTI
jgi:hypothetical protein